MKLHINFNYVIIGWKKKIQILLHCISFKRSFITDQSFLKDYNLKNEQKNDLKTNMTSDSNDIRTHNHLIRKQTPNQLAKLVSLAKWLNICLQIKELWVWILLLSVKLQIWRLFWVRSSLTFSQTIECRFTLKLVCYMIIKDRQTSMTL